MSALDTILERQDLLARLEWADNSRTDLGNAERFITVNRNLFIFVDGLGWMRWDGARFALDELHAAENALIAAVRNGLAKDIENAYRAVAGAGDDDENERLSKIAKRLWDWARQSDMDSKITAAMRRAEKNPRIARSASQLDADPDVLNVANGVLDLRTFELLPHDPRHLMTKVAGAAYHEDAVAEAFLADLERFIPDPDVRAFLARVAGQALTGHRSEQLLYLYGLGANWKSTLLQALRETMGDYAGIAYPDLFISTSGKRSVADRAMVAELRGLRLVTTSEIGKGEALAEALLKGVTETELKGEFKYRDSFTFRNQSSLMLSANYRMRVDGTDEGVWRRLSLVEFGVQVPEAERDPDHFESQLRPELDGILTWMVDGLRDYRARGDKLDPPEAVKAATDAYRSQSDIVGRWMKEALVFTDDAEDYIVSQQAYDYVFEPFRKKEFSAPVAMSEWRSRLLDAGARSERRRLDDGQKTVLVGVKLKDELPDL